MQEHDGGSERARRERGQHEVDRSQAHCTHHRPYGSNSKDSKEQSGLGHGRVATAVFENRKSLHYQSSRYCSSSFPAGSSAAAGPPEPAPGVMGDRGINPDRRSLSSWSVSSQEPIGTGAKKKIVKSQDKRNSYSADPRHHHDRYKEVKAENERQRKDKKLTSVSNSSLDFYTEGERMVSELCNITEPRTDKLSPRKCGQDDDKSKHSITSEALLTALDKIIIHDQIPNQIVQLAIEACSDAENIAIAHHNRPCFKNIHSICAKTRSNVQKPDSAVANLHSQGIPWVIKNFIFSFVRILDGWKGVKELLSEKHDNFSRIENKYYSPNIRECFVQWQAVTKEMLTHIYKTFKCLDHGFTMEQKSVTHYYATHSAAPRHQNQKYPPTKSAHACIPRPVSGSPQPYNAIQPPWVQSQAQGSSQPFGDNSWQMRTPPPKKFPIVPPPSHSFYPQSDQSDMDYEKAQYKMDPSIRESKPRQSWTITNVPDFKALEGMCHAEQRELYTHLKHKMDAELGKAPGQPLHANSPCDYLQQRREMELKAKMIPLSHVEKTLIPSMATAADIRGCYLQKNNSCGDTKEESVFFAAWGQMVQKENEFLTHHAHSIPIPQNVVTLPNNISGPVQYPDNDEFHEFSKVYMKPGSYKVPIKPDPTTPFLQGAQEVVFEGAVSLDSPKVNVPFPPVTLAPQPKYSIENWPCMSRRSEELFTDDPKIMAGMPYMDIHQDSLEFGAVTSDRAWEAAKQSAPKLMDYIHEGSKSDTARLYDALGLSVNDEYPEEIKQLKLNCDQQVWLPDIGNHYLPKVVPNLWDQSSAMETIFSDDCPKFNDISKSTDNLDQSDFGGDEVKEPTRCVSFDKSGNCIRDESHKKNSKPKISPGWYHPKNKKPLPPNTMKKFESILSKLTGLAEAGFIQHDMDIKTAPRFYEVVKHPMCLHDIYTKLTNSSYSECEQVVQDFRRIFSNVKLYLKNFPDQPMKKNLGKVAAEFEKMLSEEFQKGEVKGTDGDVEKAPGGELDSKGPKGSKVPKSPELKEDPRGSEAKPLAASA